MNKELLNKRQKWYGFVPVLYELAKTMKDREVVFMDRIDNSKCIRGLCIRSADFLQYAFEKFDFYNRDYNIYISLAKYSHIPNFTYNLSERSKETNKWFHNQARSEIFEYDILLDFDMKKIENFNYMKNKVQLITNLLYINNICFSVYPSGNNFQIIIYSCNFDLGTDKLIPFSKVFVEKIKERFNLEFLDLKGMGIFNKLRKCEYSLVSDKVVLPIKNDLVDIEDKVYSMQYDLIDSNIVLRTEQIKHRGQCIFNHNPEQNIIAMKIFLKRFWID